MAGGFGMKKNNKTEIGHLFDYIKNYDDDIPFYSEDCEGIAFWKEEFATFNNTPEERRNLIEYAFRNGGEFRKQKIFCDVANSLGYFNNEDFVEDMLDLYACFICQIDSNDFLYNYGLLNDISFVSYNVFYDDASYNQCNLLFMAQAFGLKECIEYNPVKMLEALQTACDEEWDIMTCFITEPEAFNANIPKSLKSDYTKLFKEIKTTCNKFVGRVSQKDYECWKNFLTSKT